MHRLHIASIIWIIFKKVCILIVHNLWRWKYITTSFWITFINALETHTKKCILLHSPVETKWSQAKQRKHFPPNSVKDKERETVIQIRGHAGKLLCLSWPDSPSILTTAVISNPGDLWNLSFPLFPLRLLRQHLDLNDSTDSRRDRIHFWASYGWQDDGGEGKIAPPPAVYDAWVQQMSCKGEGCGAAQDGIKGNLYRPSAVDWTAISLLALCLTQQFVAAHKFPRLYTSGLFNPYEWGGDQNYWNISYGKT